MLFCSIGTALRSISCLDYNRGAMMMLVAVSIAWKPVASKFQPIMHCCVMGLYLEGCRTAATRASTLQSCAGCRNVTQQMYVAWCSIGTLAVGFCSPSRERHRLWSELDVMMWGTRGSERTQMHSRQKEQEQSLHQPLNLNKGFTRNMHVTCKSKTDYLISLPDVVERFSKPQLKVECA